MNNTALLNLWGKAKEGHTHPLLYHAIDVGHVVSAIWDNVFTLYTRKHISKLMGLSLRDTKCALSYWGSLHDLGKATPAFQIRYPQCIWRLRKAGLTFRDVDSSDRIRHGIMTARTAPLVLHSTTGTPLSLSYDIAYAIGAHHGSWPDESEVADLLDAAIGDETWWAVRETMGKILSRIFMPSPPVPFPISSSRNAVMLVLSGIVSAADLMGSNTDYFPYCQQKDLQRYITMSQSRAKQVVSTIMTSASEVSQTANNIASPLDLDTLYPIQSAALSITEQADAPPSISIIQSATGTGKTKAALHLVLQHMRQRGQQGFYIAMPTRVSSDAMLQRIKSIMQDATVIQVQSGLWQSTTWFKGKRAFLSPYGVGTIDQALKSVMPTPHFFLRLIGLSHKTIVFDEVHAYDCYMSVIFFRLLEWLRVVDASVIILTATLPLQMLQKAVQAYTGKPLVVSVPHSSILVADGNTTQVYKADSKSTKKVNIEWIERQDVVSVIFHHIEEHSVCVICNTIARAQSLYNQVIAQLEKPNVKQKDIDVYLLHSRLTSRQRHNIEKQILQRFGRHTTNSTPAIVISTQIVEQSLDISFGAMVSDMCPADVFIQRIGRLQRHKKQVAVSTCYIISPMLFGGVPRFSGGVYDKHVLLRSYLLLREQTLITLPDDTEKLLSVYDGQVSPPKGLLRATRNAWYISLREHQRKMQRMGNIAATRIISRPQTTREVFIPPKDKNTQLTTRLYRPSITAVCLHANADNELFLDPQMTQPLLPIDEQRIADIIETTVPINYAAIVKEIISQPCIIKEWHAHKQLKYIRPLIFHNGQCQIGAYVIRYVSDAVGVSITRVTNP